MTHRGFERFIAAEPEAGGAFLSSSIKSVDSITEAWDRLCIRADCDRAFVP
ncbi:MAG: hypothetical protein HRT64_03715 [Erythrobacter sp.]|nr:hypothetical protein [Erythrobacter sp.]